MVRLVTAPISPGVADGVDPGVDGQRQAVLALDDPLGAVDEGHLVIADAGRRRR